MATATKRKASKQEDSRLKKVAKKASTKSVGAIKSGIESLSLGKVKHDVDDNADEADESSKSYNLTYIKLNCPANIRYHFHSGPILWRCQQWLYC